MKRIYFISVASISLFVFNIGSVVFAQGSSGSNKLDSVEVTNPLGDVNSVPQLINNIVTVILGIVGAIALAMFIYGGVMWLTSAGNQQRIEKGRETLVWATIGLLIIFSSFAILRTIFAALEG